MRKPRRMVETRIRVARPIFCSATTRSVVRLTVQRPRVRTHGEHAHLVELILDARCLLLHLARNTGRPGRGVVPGQVGDSLRDRGRGGSGGSGRVHRGDRGRSRDDRGRVGRSDSRRFSTGTELLCGRGRRRSVQALERSRARVGRTEASLAGRRSSSLDGVALVTRRARRLKVVFEALEEAANPALRGRG